MNVSPLNETGNPTDWWFLYKVPKLAKGIGSAGATGYEYLYFDPEGKKLNLSPYTLNSGQGALDLTLASFFENFSASTGWLLYNDEMPASATRTDDGSFGHTKGLIAFDLETKTALWLLHSWPKFADPEAKEVVKPTPLYGQTFICLALDLDTAGLIAAQMIDHQEPQSYLPHLPTSLSKSDALYRLTQTVDPNAGGDSDAQDYKTHGGMPFKVIAKNRKWGKDFWNELVGPTLKDDMDVETWIRGPIASVLDSDGIHKTFDIKYIDMRPLGATWAWPESKDHAKWGITYKNDWVCVGDINRMISQEQRGGGTIALQDPNLWNALKKTELIVPPPGHTRDSAMKIIQSSHLPTNNISA